MDIEQFYDADDRRRQSDEVELGTEWRDSHNVRYELNWIEATSELYVMREPPPPMWEDPFGDIYVEKGRRAPVTGMTVLVIAKIKTREQLEKVLEGWQVAMGGDDGIGWLVTRLRTSGLAEPNLEGA